MPRTIEKTVYLFSELSDEAKAKARDWYRSCDDGEYLDNVVDDFAEICRIIGVEFDTRYVPLMNGKSRARPEVFYSVGYCQSDYAAFAGTLRYRKGCKSELKEYAPVDKKLEKIVDDWCAINRLNFYRLCARCSSSRDYQRVDEVYRNDDVDVSRDTEREVVDIVRRLADWLYDRLREECDYQNSDEQVDESILANEYEFTENGRIAA